MKLKLKPESPFNFDLSAKIYSNGDPQIQKYEGGLYWQVIKLNNKLVLIKLRSVGNVKSPELSLKLATDKNLSKEDILKSKEIVSKIFNLDFKLKHFYEDMNNDELMKKLIKKLWGLNSPTTQTFFEAMVISIIEQQISLKAAHNITNRMIKKFGDKLKIENQTYYGFPTPETFIKIDKEDLRRCGLSFRKSEYVIGFSECIVNNKIILDKFNDMETSDIIQELIKIRGIGFWTAELSVLRGMHRLDALPSDDVGIRRVVSHYYNNDQPISSDELGIIANLWGKWGGLAAFYLIIADMMSIEI